MILKKYYEIDEVFSICSKIDNRCNKLYEFKPKRDKNSNKKAWLRYFKIIKNEPIDSFSTCNFSEIR